MKLVAQTPLVVLNDRPEVDFKLYGSNEIHTGTFIGHDFIQYPDDETGHPIYHAYSSVETFNVCGGLYEEKLKALREDLERCLAWNITTTCIYHAGCSDGLMSAAVVQKYFDGYDNINFVEGRHGEAINVDDYANHLIIMVDFSYDVETMVALEKTSSMFILLDHHKTTMERIQESYDDCTSLLQDGYVILADKLSGCGLTWKVLFPDHRMPMAVRYVQDADLWTWKELNSKQIVAAIYEHTDKTIESYYNLLKTFEYDRFIQTGIVLVDKKTKDVEQAVKSTYQQITFRGYKVGIANCNTPLSSEVGHYIIEHYDVDFGIAFSVTHKGVRLSLRSDDHLADVSVIAQQYFNGGGHRNAAGGMISLDELTVLLQDKSVQQTHIFQKLLGCEIAFSNQQYRSFIHHVVVSNNVAIILSDGLTILESDFDKMGLQLYLTEEDDSKVSVSEYLKHHYPEVCNAN